jgi:hypothetical protein
MTGITTMHRQGRAARRFRGAAMGTPVPVAPAVPAAEGLDLAAAAIQLRRLRYFRDLLVSGLESTIWPDRRARTLRRERLALGIDLPELDAVAVWSVRHDDGTLAIPFIDFILARAHEAALGFDALDATGSLRHGIGRLERALGAVTPPGAASTALPRLEAVQVPETLVAGLCGSGGVLDHLVAACELVTLTAVHLAPPEAS